MRYTYPENLVMTNAIVSTKRISQWLLGTVNNLCCKTCILLYNYSGYGSHKNFGKIPTIWWICLLTKWRLCLYQWDRLKFHRFCSRDGPSSVLIHKLQNLLKYKTWECNFLSHILFSDGSSSNYSPVEIPMSFIWTLKTLQLPCSGRNPKCWISSLFLLLVVWNSYIYAPFQTVINWPRILALAHFCFYVYLRFLHVHRHAHRPASEGLFKKYNQKKSKVYLKNAR